MEEQKERYTCQKCGGVISIHDRECSECQQDMDIEEIAYMDEGRETLIWTQIMTIVVKSVSFCMKEIHSDRSRIMNIHYHQ